MTEAIAQDEGIRNWTISVFGGANQRDQADELAMRSHVQDGGGNWVPRPGVAMESPSLQNIDFFGTGHGKRLGSTQVASLASVLVSGDALVEAKEWRNPSSAARVLIAVSKKTVYFSNDNGLTWTQALAPSGLAYTHADPTVTKASIVSVDGHYVIGVDGSNPKLAGRGGTSLDDNYRNDTGTTTVDADSNSGQAVLNVAATTDFMVGDRIRINAGGARDESGYIVSISAGASVTLAANLASTHTAVQADVVQVANRWTEAYRSNTTHVITGDFPETGTYLLAAVNDQLVWSNGNTLVLVSPRASAGSSLGVSGVWDVTNSTFLICEGRLIAMKSFVPYGGDENLEQLALFTSEGPTVTTGFEAYDKPQQRKFEGVPLNHRSVCSTKNWLMFLSDKGRVLAYNGFQQVDVGARCFNDDETGVLQEVSEADSLLSAWAYFEDDRQRAIFAASTSTGYTNDLWLVVDLRLDPMETLEERLVRLVPWRIANPASNPWFHGMFTALRGPVGFTAAGVVYDHGLGRSDLGNIAIEPAYFTPQFHAGLPTTGKQFLTTLVRSLPFGDWDLNVEEYFDRSTAPSLEWAFRQIPAGADVYGTGTYGDATYGDSRTVRAAKDVNRYREVIQLNFYNNVAGQRYVVSNVQVPYIIGAEVR